MLSLSLSGWCRTCDALHASVPPMHTTVGQTLLHGPSPQHTQHTPYGEGIYKAVPPVLCNGETTVAVGRGTERHTIGSATPGI